MGILFHRHMRRHLITTLNRMAAEAPDATTQSQINAILNRQDALSELDARVEEMAVSQHVDGLLEALNVNSPRQGGAILQWLWAHRQQIMQFVRQILTMFGINIPLPIPPAPTPAPTQNP